MPQMTDYITWRGDLTFMQQSFGEIDALILTQLSYLHFADVLADGERRTLRELTPLIEAQPREPGKDSVIEDRHALLLRAANCVRFGDLLISDAEDVFDMERDIQFAAMLVSLPNGVRVVAYRGTDSTLVGWREDLNMSFECPVPAQAEAVRYIERVAAAYNGRIQLCGHSKGGNLAVYSAACCLDTTRERIDAVYSFDGPGLDGSTLASPGYRAALPKVRHFVPQTSVIGMLMGVPERYTVVHSTTYSLKQHNTFTWELDGPRFVALPRVDAASRFIKATLDDWLKDSTRETRKVFVETLFDVLEASNARTLKEMRASWSSTAAALWSATSTLDPSTRKVIVTVASSLFASGMETAKDFLTRAGDAGKPLPPGKEH